MHTPSLDGDQWTVRAVGDLAAVPDHIRGRVFPARVPGCVHLDLIRAGVLRHPNLGYAEREQEWIGRTDWLYETTFDAKLPFRAVALRFACLDALAAIELNGRLVGRSANAFRPQEFDGTRDLRSGGNHLAVTLAAPVRYVERAYAEGGRMPYNGDFLRWAPFQMLRKPACNFGWDWGPRVPTAGIGGSVQLLDNADPMPARISTRHAGDRVWHIDLSMPDRALAGTPPPCTLCLRGDPARGVASRIVNAPSGEPLLRVIVDQPRLWWPAGHGDQPLYDLAVDTGGDGSRRYRIGFRHASLDTAPDEDGTGFAIRINGERVFCRGANWIPDALFAGEATPDRVRARVAQAAAANMNMLRVWGGGLYEQDAFYDACDELGIMVWQDFMFACAMYPEGQLRHEVLAEAAEQAHRLAHHPSLVLWCGGNECVEGFQHWGWKEKMGAMRAWGQHLWCRDLPRVSRAADPDIPYWPNSPWSGAQGEQPDLAYGKPRGIEHSARDPDHGDRHTWDLHFDDVRKLVPRFVSEFGRIAPACERTLHEAEVLAEGFADAAPAAWPREAPPWNDATRAALEHRLRQTGGSKIAYDPVLPEHFRIPATDLRAWLWQTQALQCRALTTHIEWLRANAPRCMGTLLWQLNDCWACQSWSIIDAAGRPKPAWYAVRRAFEPRLLTIQPLGHGADPAQDQGFSGPPAEALSIVLINDTDEPAGAPCRVRRVTFGGLVLAARELPLGAAPRTNATLPDLAALVGEPDDPSTECLVAEWGAHRARWFWERDLRLHLPDDPLSAECIRGADGLTVRLRARALAKDIILAADLLGEHARADDNSFTLLPGETREVRIAGVAACALPVPEFVRCASGPATPA